MDSPKVTSYYVYVVFKLVKNSILLTQTVSSKFPSFIGNVYFTETCPGDRRDFRSRSRISTGVEYKSDKHNLVYSIVYIPKCVTDPYNNNQSTIGNCTYDLNVTVFIKNRINRPDFVILNKIKDFRRKSRKSLH